MAHLLKQMPHKYKPTGYHLVFDDGHEYSLVNLSELPTRSQEYTIPAVVTAMEHVGELYDGMGGRFEAILLSSDDHNWSDPIRAGDYDALIKLVQVEEYNHAS